MDYRSGLIDRDSATIIPIEYKTVHNFSNNLALVQPVSDLYGFADKNGKLAIPATFSDAQDFQENLAAVKLRAK